ncbi:hypothetical protein YC2023_050817 [Brassica napus]
MGLHLKIDRGRSGNQWLMRAFNMALQLILILGTHVRFSSPYLVTWDSKERDHALKDFQSRSNQRRTHVRRYGVTCLRPFVESYFSLVVLLRYGYPDHLKLE